MDFLANQTLLVIAPHPDDEVLGCGGLIKRIKDNGGKVYVLFLTVGDTKDYTKKGISTESERMREIEAVAKYLDYDDYRIAFPGSRYHLQLDAMPQKMLIDEIESGNRVSCNAIKPSIVATTTQSDYNQDHRAVAQAVFTATRPIPARFKALQPVVIGYDSVVGAHWSAVCTRNPNFFVPLSRDDFNTKVTAFKQYASQVNGANHTRSFKAIKQHAGLRGAQCGEYYAEAFYTYRIVV